MKNKLLCILLLSLIILNTSGCAVGLATVKQDTLIQGKNEKATQEQKEKQDNTTENSSNQMLSEDMAVNKLYNEVFVEGISNNILGIIINEPTDEILQSVEYLERYTHIEQAEQLLFVPKYTGTKITIEEVSFGDSGMSIETVLYDSIFEEEKGALLLETIRPEGIPQLMITMTYKELEIEYLMSYDGKNGTPQMEFLQLEGIVDSQQCEEIKGEDIKVIYPISTQILQDDGYLEEYKEQYQLIDKQQQDIDRDGSEESIELYSTAGYDENGELLLDDGQLWTLIVREEDKIYPVFEPTYIQLGGLEYRVYIEHLEEGGDALRLLITEGQGAGILIYDTHYDEKTDTFKRELVYQTTGNISVY